MTTPPPSLAFRVGRFAAVLVGRTAAMLLGVLVVLLVLGGPAVALYLLLRLE